MKTNWKNYLTVFGLCVALFACTDDDDDTPSQSGNNNITPDDTELITTVQLIITDSATNVVIDTVEFSDPDGQGGNAPTVETININSDQTYLVDLKFYDESDPNDIEDKTIEILEEDDEHLVCFDVEGFLLGLNITRTDTDGNLPVGISSKWRSAGTGNSTVKVTLKHQPGVKDGSCDVGETDIEVNFPIAIQ